MLHPGDSSHLYPISKKTVPLRCIHNTKKQIRQEFETNPKKIVF